MKTVSLTLDEIYNLAKHTLEFNGCDNINAELVATTNLNVTCTKFGSKIFTLVVLDTD